MKELTFVDAVRYVFAGVIAFGYFTIFDPPNASLLATGLGPVGLPLVLSVLGTLCYFTYRTLLYDFILHPLSGWFRTERSNYRKYLRVRHQLDGKSLSREDASSLFRQLMREHRSTAHDRLLATAAGIHMTYMAGLLAIPFALAAYFDDYRQAYWIPFTVAASLFLVAATLMDWRCERIETDLLRSITKEARNTEAKKQGFSEEP